VLCLEDIDRFKAQMLCFVVIGITGRYQNSELIDNTEHIKYFSFQCWHFNDLSDIQKISAGSLSDLIAIRDGQLCLPPLFFSSQQSVTLLITCAHL